MHHLTFIPLNIVVAHTLRSASILISETFQVRNKQVLLHKLQYASQQIIKKNHVITGEYSENSVIMQPITTKNVKEKAELMLEQYGRTASLFPHNMAMISMGDDFRFTNPLEWDQQYDNYMQLFDYINSHKEKYNAEVKFGTVLDYFDVRKEIFLN
jgi:hypothetical protein